MGHEPRTLYLPRSLLLETRSAWWNNYKLRGLFIVTCNDSGAIAVFVHCWWKMPSNRHKSSWSSCDNSWWASPPQRQCYSVKTKNVILLREWWLSPGAANVWPKWIMPSWPGINCTNSTVMSLHGRASYLSDEFGDENIDEGVRQNRTCPGMVCAALVARLIKVMDNIWFDNEPCLFITYNEIPIRSFYTFYSRLAKSNNCLSFDM